LTNRFGKLHRGEGPRQTSAQRCWVSTQPGNESQRSNNQQIQSLGLQQRAGNPLHSKQIRKLLINQSPCQRMPQNQHRSCGQILGDSDFIILLFFNIGKVLQDHQRLESRRAQSDGTPFLWSRDQFATCVFLQFWVAIIFCLVSSKSLGAAPRTEQSVPFFRSRKVVSKCPVY
jgi:hypothetical protein